MKKRKEPMNNRLMTDEKEQKRPDDRQNKRNCIENPDQCEKEREQRKKRLDKYWKEWRRLNQDHRRVWTPWLLIRYRDTDMGLRPIPSGEQFWLSPDIWIESSDPWGRGVVGEENFVHARVFNLGKANSLPTRVDFYWADPSIGLGAANMNLIGTEWVEVDAHTAKDVRCNTPWIPVFLNNGHECLKVNCSNLILDPITQPFQPSLDRHVGQRNISVIPGGIGETIHFTLTVNNVFPMSLKARVTTRIEHLIVDQAAIKALKSVDIVNMLVSFGQIEVDTPRNIAARYTPEAKDFKRASQLSKFLDQAKQEFETVRRTAIRSVGFTRRSSCIYANWTNHSCIVMPSYQAGAFPTDLFRAKEELSNISCSSGSRREITVQEANFNGFEQKELQVDIGVPSNAKPGEFIVVHFQQWSVDMLVGGYSVVIEIR